MMDEKKELIVDQAAWDIGGKCYLVLQECDSGWDYTLYDKSFKEIDGGQLDDPKLTIYEAREMILQDMECSHCSRTPLDYEVVTERAAAIAEAQHQSVLVQLKGKHMEKKEKSNDVISNTVGKCKEERV